MNETPSLTPSLTPAGHLSLRGRPLQLRSTSDSPARQRYTDDLLYRLTPRSAVATFRNPSGILKACMDESGPAEQAFALRTAVASQKIQEWLEELSGWPWPGGDGSAGFEAPAAKRRRLSRSEGSLPTPGWLSEDKAYLGCLLVNEVAAYERRLDEIAEDMEELDLEEIKSHVLHNHILPLSRPGTPATGSSRSTASVMSYNKMDDFTALLTATVIQALPMLSRLTRLMNVWNARLIVLRKTPDFLHSLDDAENVLESAWNSIDIGPKLHEGALARDKPSDLARSTLSQTDFQVMKSFLQREILKAARNLDFMLDSLEGYEDTLPEVWMDRINSLESEYSEWVAACERKIQEAEWAKSLRERPISESSSDPVKHERPETTLDSTGQSSTSVPSNKVASDLVKSIPPAIKIHVASSEYANPPDSSDPHTPEARGTAPQLGEEPAALRDEEVQPYVSEFDGPSDGNASPEIGLEPQYTQQATREYTPDTIASTGDDPMRDLDFLLDGPSQFEAAEPELPTLPSQRRNSDTSVLSTVVHGSPTGSMVFSSDPIAHGTPDLPRLRPIDTTQVPDDDMSPPSSPPAFLRSSTRSQSVSFNDMPTVRELPDEGTPSKTLGDSLLPMDADLSQDVGSAGKTSAYKTDDDHLQQQISEILQSIPAKIKLTSGPSAINLNPPDFTPPTLAARPRADPIPRSQSSLSTRSSRSGTPSFLLAPAYGRNSRARQQRGNQDIKLYHLSRSNGEAPIKLFIRCVGENGERVMVRVGGGWADLGEYLKEYASHHGSRSGKEGKVEIRDLHVSQQLRSSLNGSSPPSRPNSALDTQSPTTPLHVRKTRRSVGSGPGAGAGAGAVGDDGGTGRPGPGTLPRTPLTAVTLADMAPSPGMSTHSRSSSRLSWTEEDSSLGMAGPRAKNIEMSDENKAWVESVKEKVRIASSERKVSESLIRNIAVNGNNNNNIPATTVTAEGGGGGPSKFGEIGKVGATKRLFRKSGTGRAD